MILASVGHRQKYFHRLGTTSWTRTYERADVAFHLCFTLSFPDLVGFLICFWLVLVCVWSSVAFPT